MTKLKPLRLMLMSGGPGPGNKASRGPYLNLKLLSFRLLLKYASHMIPTAVAKAAMMLREARTMVDVLIDRTAFHLNWLMNNCELSVPLVLVADW